MKPVQPLWKKRFSKRKSSLFLTYNASIFIDWYLLPYDLWLNRVYSEELHRIGILTKKEIEKVRSAYNRVEKEIRMGTFPLTIEGEDVHTHIEERITSLAGEGGKKIHTGRSRNEQVVTDLKLFLRDWGDLLDESLGTLIEDLLNRAEGEKDTLFPGFTHLQPAQWITFGHYLHSIAESLLRHREQYHNWRYRHNLCPLGSSALGGTTIPINRERIAKELQFRGITRNSLDSISRRDFLAEFLFFLTSLWITFSRWMEDWILFSSYEFSLLLIPEEFCTGSSLMPQKRNPDLLELIRGKAGKAISLLNQILILEKGLPTSYQKDLQEDKSGVFLLLKETEMTLLLLRTVVQKVKVRAEGLEKYRKMEGLVATDIVDFLQKNFQLPFRTAYEEVANWIRIAEEKNLSFKDLPSSLLKKVHPSLTPEMFSPITPENSVKKRNLPGGTSPESVLKNIAITRKENSSLPKVSPALRWALSIPQPPFPEKNV